METLQVSFQVKGISNKHLLPVGDHPAFFNGDLSAASQEQAAIPSSNLSERTYTLPYNRVISFKFVDFTDETPYSEEGETRTLFVDSVFMQRGKLIAKAVWNNTEAIMLGVEQFESTFGKNWEFASLGDSLPPVSLINQFEEPTPPSKARYIPSTSLNCSAVRSSAKHHVSADKVEKNSLSQHSSQPLLVSGDMVPLHVARQDRRRLEDSEHKVEQRLDGFDEPNSFKVPPHVGQKETVRFNRRVRSQKAIRAIEHKRKVRRRRLRFWFLFLVIYFVLVLLSAVLRHPS